MDQNEQMFNQQQPIFIREATNIPMKDDSFKGEIKTTANSNIDLMGNEGAPKIR